MNIADLPFHERPAREVLGLEHALGDDVIDTDYAGYGWARVDRIWLDDATARRAVDDALVLALHAADDAVHPPGDVELAFVLDAATGASASVLASAFLERWLPRLPRARAIVLAMCNPGGARLRAPAAAGGVPLYHGIGDVDSWLDDGALRLTAAAWHLAPENAP